MIIFLLLSYIVYFMTLWYKYDVI